MTEPTEDIVIPEHYSLEDRSTNYEKFFLDAFPQERDEKSKRVCEYLRENLTKVETTENGEPKEKTASPTNTSDDTVRLMQLRLHQLSPDTEEETLEEFEHQRSITIATFRVLNRLPSLFEGKELGMSFDDLILDLRMKLDGLFASTEKEIYWRSVVYERTGSVLYKSREEMDRRNGYRSNPDGKVSLDEMNSLVLPRVVKILGNLSQTL